MYRYQGKRRALQTGRYGEARYVLGPLSGELRETPQASVSWRQGEGKPGATAAKDAPRGPYRASPLRRPRNGTGLGGKPAYKHAPACTRSTAQANRARGCADAYRSARTRTRAPAAE